MDAPESSKLRGYARTLAARSVPESILSRSAALRGTRYLAHAARAAKSGKQRPFQMVNIGACDGVLFDDVTPWLHKIPRSKAVLVEPVPYNLLRLRQNYQDTERFKIEPIAVTREPGSITVKTFDAKALEEGTLPIEFIGCSSVTDTNLMSGKNVWGPDDPNFEKFAPFLKEIVVQSDTLQAVLDRNAVEFIDAFLVDCEGADWIVFDQLDLQRYRPGLIKVEIGALSPTDIGNVIVKLKAAGYDIGIYCEDVWAFS
ncbi:FkbM family methyltransferase [Brucella gallinifaecis]|uniref:FkbM family methyltransferase n=1 Tax=Brucella gallinifaecis TaxID=215590 RepID=A0A502BVF6_9HYPH|nr:FkbM family methyltransferase [Brucella gallinifaecis]TPF76963.1 FkbM family methyltransferase [Brucella gallinifaecis]